ncbi:MAG: TRAP transporter large permease [Spirochaetia bacterium]|nr:TRAP transporter large permease [Spirochaetia bacterium]
MFLFLERLVFPCYCTLFEAGRDTALIVLFQQTFRGLTSFSFLAVPMFMLAGNLMTRGGITERLINLAKTLVGHFVGGLAQVNVLVSLFFAGISGSAHADVAAIGSVLIPAMKKEGYDEDFAGALTAASAVLSPLLPPSIVLVVYGATFGVSIGSLFAAGLTIGLLLAITQMITTYLICKKVYSYTSRKRDSLKTVLSALKKAIIPLAMPAIIIGGILGGFFTATEASAVAALYALIISVFVYKTVRWKELYEVFLSSARTTAAIVILTGLARAFSYIVARRNIPARLMSEILGFSDNPIVLLALILITLIVAGMFVDRTTNVLLFTPIIAPILMTHFGFSSVHTGMSIIMALGIGHLTPPVGGTLLTTALIGNLKVEGITKRGWPYILGLIVIAILVLAVPQLSEFLPRTLGMRL